jgi:hypothetical protein
VQSVANQIQPQMTQIYTDIFVFLGFLGTFACPPKSSGERGASFAFKF